MARILYGLCGEGLGHASRSKILINYLNKHDHEIRIVAGGKSYNFLSKEFDSLYKIEWPSVIYKNNKVEVLHSALRVFYRTLVSSIKSFFMVRKIIKDFKPDLLITDAEPISHYAAFFSQMKRISIDNPHALLYRKYKVKFGEYLAWFFLTDAIKVSIFNADKYIIYDFFDEQIDNKQVLFLKPLIQEGILKQKPVYGDHIFVYQTSTSSGFIYDILKKFDEKFIIYGSNKDIVDGNLVFKRFNETDFYHDISHAKAVITNGGFTVISEALYLKKPIFSLPINYQFEQILNGKFVEKLGVGVYHMNLDEKKLEDFLDNLDQYKESLKSYNPGKQEETLKIIEEEIQKLLPKQSGSNS